MLEGGIRLQVAEAGHASESHETAVINADSQATPDLLEWNFSQPGPGVGMCTRMWLVQGRECFQGGGAC